MRRRRIVGVLAACAATAAVASGVHAYTTGVAKWGSGPVTIFANPSNADVSADASEAALRTALNVWNTQSGSSFQFQYGGRVSDTSTINDGRNVAIFRNVSNGSTLATTYTWWDGSNVLIDADVIFWDGGFKFFTGSSGCSSGAYIEDIAAHEFGHALGLKHSTYSDATMYATYGWCSQAPRTLAPDDVAGAKFLYPPSSGPVNTAPSISISSPGNGASFLEGTAISFTGSAADTQDGSLTSKVQWTDNGIAIGTGTSFSRVLAVGGHTIVARVTDSGGLQASRQVSVTVTAKVISGGGTSGGTLTALGRKVKGYQNVDLSWNGLTATQIDVYRDNGKVMTTPNDGAQTDSLNRKGAATYQYRVCAIGTSTCSNSATVVF